MLKDWLKGGGSPFSKLSQALRFKRGGSAVGVNIGSSSIKLVELKKSGNSWKLLHFGMVQLPEDAVVNREIANPIAVVDSLKTLVGQLRLDSKNVCTSLSGSFLIVKRMMVEVPNLKEIQEQVFWEAEQYLPFNVADVVMDFQMLSRGKDNKTDVLLVAAKKSILDAYMGCIEDAGLNPKIVDIDFFALQNLYELNYPSHFAGAAALVDIGANALKMVVVFNGVPVFTKDSTIGGRNLTAEIQKQLNLSYLDAETLKTGGTTGGMPQEVSELLSIMSQSFADEVKRGLDFYNASSSGAPVSFILLTGGSAKIPDLPKVMEDTVGVPTQLMNPFNAVTYDPAIFTPDYVSSIGPIAAVPMGLALHAGEP